MLAFRLPCAAAWVALPLYRHVTLARTSYVALRASCTGGTPNGLNFEETFERIVFALHGRCRPL